MLLDRLAQQRRMVDPGEVWNLLREVLKNGGDAGSSWPLGTWSTVSGRQFGTRKDDIGKKEQPAQFERKLSWQQRQQEMQQLRRRLSRHKLVGTHATQMESIGPMILEGPSAARYGTGEGTGKGPGFYIIPAEMNNASKSAERAQTWTPFVVAVYLPADCQLIDAPEGKGVNEMEALYGGKRKYYGFAKQEAVIPFSLYNELIVLRDPGDISMADPTLPVEQTDDEEDQVEFTQDFKR